MEFEEWYARNYHRWALKRGREMRIAVMDVEHHTGAPKSFGDRAMKQAEKDYIRAHAGFADGVRDFVRKMEP